jgi:pimeloyl-ACP methyl ester carboxylesterase
VARAVLADPATASDAQVQAGADGYCGRRNHSGQVLARNCRFRVSVLRSLTEGKQTCRGHAKIDANDRADNGPVHIVGWSYGGAVVATAALKDPALVRSLVMYEPALVSVLPADSEEGKAARQEQSKMLGPSVAAAKAGDTVQAAKLLVEAVFQLPPGGFDSQPQAVQTRVLDNARTLPLRYTSPPPTVTCDALNKFTQPTLVMHGEKTQKSFMLISDAIRNCVPGAQQVVLPNVHHGGPRQDPAAFTTAVSKFVSKR